MLEVHLGEISKPVTVLIERISDAVGGIAKPWQMKRIAGAEAQAELIRAEGRLQITELEQRALIRLAREEGKKQDNIEAITAKSIPHINADAQPELIEQDWLTHFFDRSRLISDPEMQDLWARILAGEANKPKSFAKRSVDLVAALDKEEASLFTKLCSFAWNTGGLVAIVDDIEHSDFVDNGLNFIALNHLSNIGLISFDNIITFRQRQVPKYMTAFYYGKPISLEFPNDSNELLLGCVLFTKVGLELAPICGSTAITSYMIRTLDRWFNAGIVLSVPLVGREAWMRL